MNAIGIKFLNSKAPNARLPFFAKGIITICGPSGRVTTLVLDHQSAVDLSETEDHRLVFYILEPDYQKLFAGLSLPSEPPDTQNWANITFHGGTYIGKRGLICGQIELFGSDGRMFFSSKIDGETAEGYTCDKIS